MMELFKGRDRFNILLEAIPGISPRTLSTRLDDMESAGLVTRTVQDSSPRRIRYQLTSKGEDMRHLLREIASFSLRWFGEDAGEVSPTRIDS
jgi:DNA-binding HxlR family transcriptional regulator